MSFLHMRFVGRWTCVFADAIKWLTLRQSTQFNGGQVKCLLCSAVLTNLVPLNVHSLVIIHFITIMRSAAVDIKSNIGAFPSHHLHRSRIYEH